MNPSTVRYHGLDALRGIAMLLGIVLHAALPYIPELPRELWPTDKNSSQAIRIIYDFIHIWRMPVFFILAGFFANLIVTRRSWRAWWWNRLLRIGLPMIIFFPIMGFFVPWIWKYGWSGEFYFFYSNDGQPHHLWFLWHLMIFVFCTALFRGPFLLSAMILGFTERIQLGFIQKTFVRIGTLAAQMFLRPRIPIGFICLCLFVNLPTWGELILNPLASGLYFVFGYALYTNNKLLSSIISNWASYLIAALVMFLVYSVLVLTDALVGAGTDLDGLLELLKYVVKVSCATVFSFGFIGLAEGRFGQFNERLRFISDGSYWMYLIHLPIVAFITFSMFDWTIPVIFKFMIAIALTTFVCLVSYKFFVRNTLIGLLLNGHRSSS